MLDAAALPRSSMPAAPGGYGFVTMTAPTGGEGGCPGIAGRYVTGGPMGCGMQSSSYSAIVSCSGSIEHAGHCGSRNIL